ncbi:MAG: hypothetical protein ICV66_03415 [Chitinophagaceae bacterium]|nr:hypothetical protein [Chitinophagaceae bacterium]
MFYNHLGRLLDTLQKNQPTGQGQNISSTKADGNLNQKQFPEYLLHEKREQLAEKLKDEFKTEKGKSIRLMIEALKSNKPPLITIAYKEASALYRAMKSYFVRDIGTYQSIFDYKINTAGYQNDLDAFKARVDFIKAIDDKK